MNTASTEHLKHAIESRHGAIATCAQSVPVPETFEDRPVWEGAAHVFALAGHPKATRVNAWSSPVEGSETRRRLHAVPHRGGIKSPVDAVRAAIVADRRQG